MNSEYTKSTQIKCLTSFMEEPLKQGRAGNYFRPRATLRFYLCLTGQISVKKHKLKLKFCPSRAGCGPLAVCCPLLH
jgi:hypothetical protein